MRLDLHGALICTVRVDVTEESLTLPRLLLVTLLVVVAGAGTAAWSQRHRWLSPRATAQPLGSGARGVVTALGMLEPEGKVIRVDGPPGVRLDHFAENVVEGAVVSQGDPLALLDSHAEMKAARDLAASRWEEAQKRYQA